MSDAPSLWHVTWRPVLGFLPNGEFRYLISNEGLLRSVGRGSSIIVDAMLVEGSVCNGYRKFTLNHRGIRCYRYAHQLVLSAFVGPCPEGHESLHGDGDKLNNKQTNLRWGTPLENASDRQRHGRHVSIFQRIEPSDRPIAKIRDLRNAGMSYASIGRSVGLSKTTVRAVLLGRMWQT